MTIYSAKSTGRKCQQGAEIVEFLVPLPLVFTLMYFMVEMGIAFINQTTLTHATRAAALQAVRNQGEEAQKAAADGALRSLVTWFDNEEPTCDSPTLTCMLWAAEENATGPVSVTINYDSKLIVVNNFLRLFNDHGRSDTVGLSATTVFQTFEP